MTEDERVVVPRQRLRHHARPQPGEVPPRDRLRLLLLDEPLELRVTQVRRHRGTIRWPWAAMLEIDHSQALAFRVAGHNLHERTDPLTAVAACGLQEYPPGWSAVALYARS